MTGPGAQAVRALARRPDLWPSALRTGWRLRGRGWWRRWPPGPPRDYLRFRMETAYGDPEARAPVEDVVGYFEWCRQARRRERYG